MLCGFCEMKSPRDDFILEAPEPGGIAARKNLPFYRKLGSFIINASKQFNTVNSDEKPNMLVFVRHSPDIERRDLIATIVGLRVPGGRPVYLLGRKMQKQIMEAARKIDILLWIDANASDVRGCEASSHHARTIGLTGISGEPSKGRSSVVR